MGTEPFIGRTAEMRVFQETCVEVREAASGTAEARRYDAVHGPADIGKSALAERLRGSVEGAEAVAGALVPLDELDVVDVFHSLAQLRRALGNVAPDIECPRFEAGYSLYLARFRPRDFAPARWSVGPVDPQEVFRKAVENGSKKGLEDLLAHLSGGALAGAAPGVIAGAVTTALTGAAIGVGGYLAVLLAVNYVVGMRAKIRSDAVLSSSDTLRLLAQAPPAEAKVAEFRRSLPSLLAEDLNAATAAGARSVVLLIDPVDALDDVADLRAEPFGEGLARLVSCLERGYVLTFGRSPPVAWEGRVAALVGTASLDEAFRCRGHRLSGLSARDVREALSGWAPDLDEATIGLTMASLPRLPDATISPGVAASALAAALGSRT